jgi:hypothetical protein
LSATISGQSLRRDVEQSSIAAGLVPAIPVWPPPLSLAVLEGRDPRKRGNGRNKSGRDGMGRGMRAGEDGKASHVRLDAEQRRAR